MAKTSKGVSNLITKQLASDMPIFDADQASDDIEKDCQLMKAYNWYNTLANDAKERGWFHAYAKERKLFTGEELSRIKTMDSKIFTNVGRLCSMIDTGFPLLEVEWTGNRIDAAIEKVKTKLSYKQPVNTTEKPKVNIQERMDEKAAELASDVQFMIDEYILEIRNIKKSDDSEHVGIESFINVQKIKPMVASKMLPWIKEEVVEWKELLTTKDADLIEGYSNYTLAEQKRIVRMYKKVVDILSALSVQKTARKTRKKKVKTPVQLAAKVLYLKDTKDFGGFKSVTPDKIIGKQRVILFNAKTRAFTMLEAENEHIGLTIKGTTVQGVADSLSVSKKIREKYVDDLLKVAEGKGIRAIKSAYKDIKSKETVGNGRINKDTLIVRVL